MFDISKVKDTFRIAVLVQFATETGGVTQGQFNGTFKRLPNNEIDEMMDAEPPLLNSETVDRVLIGVDGIGKDGTELPPTEQLEWVKRTPECMAAVVAAFFKNMRPERYNEKTSRKQRRG
jgi:hypothetical protein